MAEGCGPKCAKLILIIFNIVFWLSGAAILAIGIWMLVDDSIVDMLNLVQVDQDDPMLDYAAYVLIAVGAFVFIVGFFGCCGAIKENKCMLGVYIFLLLIVMAGELAAGILAIVYKDKIIEELKGKLSDKLVEDTMLTVDEEGNEVYTAFGASLALAQIEFSCCGIDGPADYATSNYTATYVNVVPPSCCVPAKDADKKVDNVKAEAFANSWEQCTADAAAGITDSTNLNTKGCYDSIEKWFEEKAIILIGVGIGIACLEIFGFIFAICLCRNTSED